jgi:hypothetical protein
MPADPKNPIIPPDRGPDRGPGVSSGREVTPPKPPDPHGVDLGKFDRAQLYLLRADVDRMLSEQERLAAIPTQIQALADEYEQRGGDRAKLTVAKPKG